MRGSGLRSRRRCAYHGTPGNSSVSAMPRRYSRIDGGRRATTGSAVTAAAAAYAAASATAARRTRVGEPCCLEPPRPTVLPTQSCPAAKSDPSGWGATGLTSDWLREPADACAAPPETSNAHMRRRGHGAPKHHTTARTRLRLSTRRTAAHPRREQQRQQECGAAPRLTDYPHPGYSGCGKGSRLAC